jgi:hypothetical protein
MLTPAIPTAVSICRRSTIDPPSHVSSIGARNAGRHGKAKAILIESKILTKRIHSTYRGTDPLYRRAYRKQQFQGAK